MAHTAPTSAVLSPFALFLLSAPPLADAACNFRPFYIPVKDIASIPDAPR